ncbi:hypothetical protein ACU8OR_34115 (plasmid) [Rhizobium leguminosarum]
MSEAIGLESFFARSSLDWAAAVPVQTPSGATTSTTQEATFFINASMIRLNPARRAGFLRNETISPGSILLDTEL